MNSVHLSGNLTKDPVISTLTNNKIARFSIAVNNRDKEKTASFFDVEVWDKLAEFSENYLKKGSKILLTGRLKQDVWESDGKKNYRIKIVATEIEFNSPKSEQDNSEEKPKSNVKMPEVDIDEDQNPPF